MFKEIKALIWKEFTLEWRQKYSVYGVILYLISAVFVCYLSIKTPEKPSWNALFWIIMLFATFSAVAKSFLQEKRGRLMYLYPLAKPHAVIISKIIYNSALMAVLNLISIIIYVLLNGNLADNFAWFCFLTLAGSISFASLLTMTSAIASKAGDGNLLMPVLSLPIIIPLLLISIKASKKAVDGLDVSLIGKDLMALAGMYILILGLSYILYPFLSRD